jgi:hypothetical protein
MKYLNMYLSTMNIENYKYEISVLKNKSLKDDKEKSYVSQAEQVIKFSKYFCRVYVTLEVLNLIYKYTRRNNKEYAFKMRKVAFAYIRINIIWLLANIGTNVYLQKYSNLDKIIKKYKDSGDKVNGDSSKDLKNKFEFSQYIQHKN